MNIKLDNRIYKLTNMQALTYAWIVYMIQTKKFISRAYLCKVLKIKDKEQISDYINAIEKAGLISKSYKRVGIKIHYIIKLTYKRYYLVNWIVLSKRNGLALRLRAIAFNDSLRIKYSFDELKKILNIPVGTLKKLFPNGVILPFKELFYHTYKPTKVSKLVCLYGRISRLATWVIKNVPTLYQDCFYNRILAGTLKTSRSELTCAYLM